MLLLTARLNLVSLRVQMATGRDGLHGVHVAGGVVEEFKLVLGPAPILHHPSEALTVKARLWNEGRATRTNALVSESSLLNFQFHRQNWIFSLLTDCKALLLK